MDIKQAKDARNRAYRHTAKRAKASAALARNAHAIVDLGRLSAGDEVVLRHVGRRGVPKALHMTRARVLSVGTSDCVVQSLDEESNSRIRPRTVRDAEIAEVIGKPGAKPIMIPCDHCDGTGEVQAECSGCGESLTDENSEDDDTCKDCAAEDDAT
jgi:hypothetical protein